MTPPVGVPEEAFVRLETSVELDDALVGGPKSALNGSLEEDPVLPVWAVPLEELAAT